MNMAANILVRLQRVNKTSSKADYCVNLAVPVQDIMLSESMTAIKLMEIDVNDPFDSAK